MRKNRYFVFLILFMLFTFFSTTTLYAIDKYAKVVLIGDYRCGKTSLWKRLTNQDLNGNEQASDVMIREDITENIRGQDVQFNIWDTAGANMYYNEVVDFTHDADFVIIVHDMSAAYNGKIENYLNKLYSDIYERVRDNCKILIVGSKYDLRHENIINAGKQIGMLESVAKAIPCSCIFTSAIEKGNTGVNNIKERFLKGKCDPSLLSDQNPDANRMRRFSVAPKKGWCLLL